MSTGSLTKNAKNNNPIRNREAICPVCLNTSTKPPTIKPKPSKFAYVNNRSTIVGTGCAQGQQVREGENSVIQINIK